MGLISIICLATDSFERSYDCSNLKLSVINIVLSVVVPIVVLFVQRYFDNDRQEKENKRHEQENEPRIALGSVFSEDLSQNSSSDIRIPIFNVGKTTISNVSLKFEIEGFDDLRKKLYENYLCVEDKHIKPVCELNEDKLGKIGLDALDRQRELQGCVSFKDMFKGKEIFNFNDENGESFYLIPDDHQKDHQEVCIKGMKKVVNFEEGNMKCIKKGEGGQRFLDPMLAGKKQEVKVDIQFFIQYILFMKFYRYVVEILHAGSDASVYDDVLYNEDKVLGKPIIRFDFKFTDYNNRDLQQEAYLQLRIVNESLKSKPPYKFGWELVPILKSEINC